MDMDDAVAESLRRTHEWFEVNSGWAPPDPETMRDWAAEDACRAPDDCWVHISGTCEHGLASWKVVLDHVDGPSLWPPPASPSPRPATQA